MNFIDWIILFLIFFCALNGFRKGLLSSVVAFVGSLFIFIVAFYLKNPISVFLYEKLPFFNLGGKFAGIYAYNILIYEAISYLLTIFLLGIILKIVNKITGIITFVINSTIILGIPSKLLGAVVGLLQGFIVSFVLVFVLGMIGSTSGKVTESKYGNQILESTPILSSVIGDTYLSIKEVYDIVSNPNLNDEVANLESIDVLLKYEILSVKSAKKLTELDKIKIPGINNIINKYDK